jgi:hypothetical protein
MLPSLPVPYLVSYCAVTLKPLGSMDCRREEQKMPVILL